MLTILKLNFDHESIDKLTRAKHDVDIGQYPRVLSIVNIVNLHVEFNHLQFVDLHL